MAGISVTVHDNFTTELAKKLPIAATQAEHLLAIQITKDTEPFVPALTKSLVNRTQVFGNKIVYQGPYARYLYYGLAMVDEETGLPAFRIVGKDGSEIFRFRKGAKLKVKEPKQKLEISQSVNPQATDHWIEASKNQNLKKWMKICEELIAHNLNTR